jgi:DNA-binding transcriptional LysR family regulator
MRTFQIAATKLSFKAAADELCITPSAVSYQIKTLEEQLGITLFVRGPHSLSLSDAGRAYRQHLVGNEAIRRPILRESALIDALHERRKTFHTDSAES